MSFEGVDFYDVDSLLSEEERMVRDTIRQWVEDRVMPIIGEAYIQRRFPRELIPEMGELGMLGANLPEEYGCICQELVHRSILFVEDIAPDSSNHQGWYHYWKDVK